MKLMFPSSEIILKHKLKSNPEPLKNKYFLGQKLLLSEKVKITSFVLMWIEGKNMWVKDKTNS